MNRESRHFENRVGKHFRSIKQSCDRIQKFQNLKGFNPFKMVQLFVNHNRHPGAIDHVMRALSDEKRFRGIKTTVWGYASHIMKIQNQNYNEKDTLEIHRKLKNMPAGRLSQFTHGILERI
jgi:hypothetical protein